MIQDGKLVLVFSEAIQPKTFYLHYGETVATETHIHINRKVRIIYLKIMPDL